MPRIHSSPVSDSWAVTSQVVPPALQPAINQLHQQHSKLEISTMVSRCQITIVNLIRVQIWASLPFRSSGEMQFNRDKQLNKRYLKQYQLVLMSGVQPF